MQTTVRVSEQYHYNERPSDENRLYLCVSPAGFTVFLWSLVFLQNMDFNVTVFHV